MATQMQSHLQEYVEDSIKQKIRMNNAIIAYEAQEYKTRERIIDETDLEKDYVKRGLSQDRIDLVTERLGLDQEILANIQGSIADLKGKREDLSLRLSAHLEELTEIEINAGGFIGHIIGRDKKATYDEETKSTIIEPTGNVEIPIATRLNKWRDGSQLTIKKIKGGK